MVKASTNLRNSAWNLANILLYPILFLATTTFFINKLGEEVFGEWMLLNSYIFISVHIFSFGMQHAITTHVAETYSITNKKRLFGYINAASRSLGFLFIIFIFLAITLYTSSSFEIYFKQDTWQLIALATGLIGIKMLELLQQSIFKGIEAYHTAAIFNMLNRFGALLLQFSLVLFNYALYELLLAALCVNIVVIILQTFKLNTLFPDFKLSLIKPLLERRKLYGYGFWTWLQTIIAVVSFQLDRFIVAYFLGVANVTYFVLASTIANHLHMAFEAIVSWVLPKMARLKASKKDTLSYYYTIRAFSISFSIAAIFFIYLLSEPIFTIWLGADKYEKMSGFFQLFMAFEALFIMTILPKFYLNAVKSLSLITSLELIYKTALIIGMLIYFYIIPNAESLIYGQIIVLALFLPFQYFWINKEVLNFNWWKESLVNFIPSFLLVATILIPNLLVSYILAFLAIVSCLFIFGLNKNFNKKLIIE